MPVAGGALGLPWAAAVAVFLVMAYREYMLGFARYAVDGVRRLGWSLPHGEVQYSRLGGG